MCNVCVSVLVVCVALGWGGFGIARCVPEKGRLMIRCGSRVAETRGCQTRQPNLPRSKLDKVVVVDSEGEVVTRKVPGNRIGPRLEASRPVTLITQQSCKCFLCQIICQHDITAKTTQELKQRRMIAPACGRTLRPRWGRSMALSASFMRWTGWT